MNQYSDADADMEAEEADNERERQGKAEQEEAVWLALTPEEQNTLIRSAPMPPLKRAFEADELLF